MEEFSVLKQVFGDAEKPAEAPVADPPVKEDKWGVSPLAKAMQDHLSYQQFAKRRLSEVAARYLVPTHLLREAPPMQVRLRLQEGEEGWALIAD